MAGGPSRRGDRPIPGVARGDQRSRQIEATAAELAEANERLRRIDAQKDEFLDQISHEVRTPRASIRSFSDILLNDDELDEESKRRFLTIIQNESLRLIRLLDGILDLSLIEQGGPAWDSPRFDPEAALDQAMETCEALAHGAGVTLERTGRARRVTIEGDRDKLAQVFIYLISNAIKYNTSPHPQVTVWSTSRKGIYEVRVSDNGPGILERGRERVFPRYSRGGGPAQPSAGLGLAISRHIVERFGSTLDLRASREGGAVHGPRRPGLKAAGRTRPVSRRAPWACPPWPGSPPRRCRAGRGSAGSAR